MTFDSLYFYLSITEVVQDSSRSYLVSINPFTKGDAALLTAVSGLIDRAVQLKAKVSRIRRRGRGRI